MKKLMTMMALAAATLCGCYCDEREQTANTTYAVTVDEIIDAIERAVPYRKKDIANDFTGVSFIATGTYYFIHDIDESDQWHRNNGATHFVVIRNVTKKNPFFEVRFPINIDKALEFKTLKKGATINVVGKIGRATEFAVFL